MLVEGSLLCPLFSSFLLLRRKPSIFTSFNTLLFGSVPITVSILQQFRVAEQGQRMLRCLIQSHEEGSRCSDAPDADSSPDPDKLLCWVRPRDCGLGRKLADAEKLGWLCLNVCCVCARSWGFSGGTSERTCQKPEDVKDGGSVTKPEAP